MPCRFAVAFPVPRPLEHLAPPLLILDDVGSATNVGQAAQSACLLGVTSLVVSAATWSSLNGRAARVSHGWLYHCEFHRADSLPEALRALRAGGLRLYAAEEYFSQPVAPHSPAGDRNWALVIGSEDRGVSPEVAEQCHARVRIPQRRGASLNAATAATLCLHELSRHMGP
ncbi:unnamed protein product [Prorocentrum cordatum]|uniref:tRNA/rRNA methyltransferase SpoU type domain-containing protein n=1 Tax=Prorocentrum cordatum TaxID=2364126 RepID=A0ABN9R7E1_9DINO|nr:unnamed protein product [Polarella glacialis]